MTRTEAVKAGCKCNLADWGKHRDNINPICDNFEEDMWGLCLHCEHEEACHEN